MNFSISDSCINPCFEPVDRGYFALFDGAAAMYNLELHKVSLDGSNHGQSRGQQVDVVPGHPKYGKLGVLIPVFDLEGEIHFGQAQIPEVAQELVAQQVGQVLLGQGLQQRQPVSVGLQLAQQIPILESHHLYYKHEHRRQTELPVQINNRGRSGPRTIPNLPGKQKTRKRFRFSEVGI